jgi:molybdopterin synthase catalytic subunit
MHLNLIFSSAVYSNAAADFGSMTDISTIHTIGMLMIGENILCLYLNALNASVCNNICADMIDHLGEHNYPLKECLTQKKCIKSRIYPVGL